MNPQCTADMLKMCAKKAGIEHWEDMHICNHLMRTSGATIKYHNGVDIEVLQNILGHSNIDTTIKHYVKNINDKAMDVMSVAGF
jgi:site-specific recombinase XerD